MNTQTIKIDVSKQPAVAQVVRVGQCDSSGTTIVAQVYDNGVAADLTGMSAMFEMRLPDGQSYVRDANCTVSGNEITYVVDEEHCASVPGITDEAYFDIMDGPSVVYSTGRFRVVVMKSAHADGVPAESWDNAIDALIQRGEEFMDDVEQHGIPLMASSVRGGAKLGSGLQVSDETLSVDPVTNAQIDSVAADASVTGSQVLNATGLTRLWSKIKAAFAAVTHSHAASDITSGTLAVARGGTNASTADAARTNLDAAQSEGASGSLADAEQAIADVAADVATLGESVSHKVPFRYANIANDDLNNYIDAGMYAVYNGQAANSPSGSKFAGVLLVMCYGQDRYRVFQIHISCADNSDAAVIYVRHSYLYTNTRFWSAWSKLM